MAETTYLIERGGERKYVTQADLNAHLKDGWTLLGKLIPCDEKDLPVRKPKAKNSTPSGEESLG